jgi:hypothetical protein
MQRLGHNPLKIFIKTKPSNKNKLKIIQRNNVMGYITFRTFGIKKRAWGCNSMVFV